MYVMVQFVLLVSLYCLFSLFVWQVPSGLGRLVARAGKKPLRRAGGPLARDFPLEGISL